MKRIGSGKLLAKSAVGVRSQYFCTSLHKNISAFFLRVPFFLPSSHLFCSFSQFRLFCFGYLFSFYRHYSKDPIFNSQCVNNPPIHLILCISHGCFILVGFFVLFCSTTNREKVNYATFFRRVKRESRNECEMFLAVWIFQQKGSDSKKSTFFAQSQFFPVVSFALFSFKPVDVCHERMEKSKEWNNKHA